jgi:hypothetical protein
LEDKGLLVLAIHLVALMASSRLVDVMDVMVVWVIYLRNSRKCLELKENSEVRQFRRRGRI